VRYHRDTLLHSNRRSEQEYREYLDGLLARAKSGDEEALNTLLGELRPYLKTIANRKLDRRVRIRKDPSDLVQETLVQGFLDFGRFAGATMEELRGFLKTILKRNAIDTLRGELDAFRRSVTAERSLDEPGGGNKLRDQLVNEHTSPSGIVARNQQTELLLAAIAQLPDAQRKALNFWKLGFTYQEIAEELQRTESAAQSLVKHALKSLREQFPDGFGEKRPEGES